MLFDKERKLFKEYISNEGYSKRTEQSYSYEIGRFCSYLEKYYPSILKIEDIKPEVLQDYAGFVTNTKSSRGKYYANKTKRLKIIAVRKFFRFLSEYDFILQNPAKRVKPPREEKTIQRNILSQDEIRDLLDKLKTNSPQNIRNRAIIELFYGCAIRTSELCSLKINDIDLKLQTVVIFNGKGGKSRVLPIGQYATEYVRLYLDVARKHFIKGKRYDEGFLFLSKRGNPFNRTTINKTVIRQIEKYLPNDKHITCYTMRHSLATHLLQNKVDILTISKLLGHSSLRSTQVYTKVDISDLQKMHSLHHPREKNKR